MKLKSLITLRFEIFFANGGSRFLNADQISMDDETICFKHGEKWIAEFYKPQLAGWVCLGDFSEWLKGDD